MARSELLYLVATEADGAIDNARAFVRPPDGVGLLALFDAPAGGVQLEQPLYSGGDGYLRAWVEVPGFQALVEVDDNDGSAVLVADHYTQVRFDPVAELLTFAQLVGHSYFQLRAVGDGTLEVAAIVATLDHGDAHDLTAFITEHADEPAIAGGTATWRADGVVTLDIADPDGSRQEAMRGFLYLCLLSGRFAMPAEVQALVFGSGS